MSPSTNEVPKGLPEPTGVVGAVELVESGAKAPANEAGSLMDEAEALEVAPKDGASDELC